MLKNMLFVSAFLVAALNAVPVMAQDACEGQVGAAFGLCNAYCEAMDCDSADAQASDNACNKVYDKFFTQTGSPPPCEISCPCFTLDDLQAGGSILECGENFAEFDDLAGIIYTDLNVACSGAYCGDGSTAPSCAYSLDSVAISGITDQEDAGCRSLIMATCENPNTAVSRQAESVSSANGSLFIDQ